MIAIPNMDKPKECKECQWHLDFYIEDEQVGGLCTITEKDDRENTCPLIEIVTCGECICYRGDHNYCYNDYFARENGFCSYGERRSDDI